MDFLNDIFCKYPLLPWLLPFLLGLAAGWALWGKFKSLVADLEGEIAGLKAKVKGLENDLSGCRSHSAELEGDLALSKGKLREAESKISDYENKAAASGKSVGDASGGSSSGASGSSGSVSSFASSGTSGSSDISAAAKGSGDASGGKYAKLKSDNLQIIEGVGPKMEEVLKANGINSWEDLSKQTPDSLKAILDKYGDTYRIIDPSTWAQQAKLAVNGDFDGLISLQKNLDTGVADAGNVTDSKLEKVLIKLGIIKTYNQDDLKVIEGVGPKIEKLLQDAGISTWSALANTSVERIQEILNAAGSNFQLADPSTWPKQAELLAAGKFKELEEYQEFLNSGKNPS